MIDITLLGTSALMPLPERALCSAYLSCGGRGILFDCGEGTQTAARRAGQSLVKTSLIALTHFHGDHYFGLPGLLQSMNALDRKEPLYITAPGDMERELAPILRLTGAMKYDIILLPMPEDGIALNEIDGGFPKGARLLGFNTAHRVESRGYAFILPRAGKFLPERARALNIPQKLWGRLQGGESVEHEGRSYSPDMVLGEPRRGLKVVFSGDTAPCEELSEAARDADLFICEATFGEDEQEARAAEYGHMTFSQAARTAAQAGVKRLWLSHYSPMIKNPEDYIGNARAVFPEACCSYDGMGMKLNFE